MGLQSLLWETGLRTGMSRVAKAFALSGALTALSALTACSGKSVTEALQAGTGDPTTAGVASAERRANGTVFVTFKGMQGSDSYVVTEKERQWVEPKASNLWNVMGLLPGSDGFLEKREVARIQHIAGKTVYEYEAAHVPFGEAFCYSVRAVLKGGSEVDLGKERCLLSDTNWRWKGVDYPVKVDGQGRVVVTWKRLPVGGSKYEITKAYPTIEGGPQASLNTVIDTSQVLDEAADQVFPRCYMVRVSHPLLSKPDKNQSWSCVYIAVEDLKAGKSLTVSYANQAGSQPQDVKFGEPKEVLKAVDLEAPKFEGLKTIEVSRSSSLATKVMSAVGIGSDVKVLLSWDEATDNVSTLNRISYQVFRSEVELGFDFKAPLATVNPGTFTYVDTSITKGSTYYYLVRAVDDQGNQEQNLNQKKLPLDLQPPTFAGVVAGTTKRVGGQVRVVLSWNSAQDDQTPPQGIIYEIYRSQSEGAFDSQALSKVSGVTYFEDGTTEKNQIYYYRVNAVDREGNRDINAKVVMVNTGETPPRFEGLLEARLFNRAGRLRWDPAEDDESPTNAIYYRVFRREEGQDFNFKSPIIQTTPGVLQFEDASINPNKTYYYIVRAVDEQGFEDQNAAEKQMAANKAPTLGTQPGSGNAPVVTWDKQQNCARVVWPTATDDSTASTKIRYRIFKGTSSNVSSFNLTNYTEEEGKTRWIDPYSCGQSGAFSYMISAIDGDEAVSARTSVGLISSNQPPTGPIVTYKAIVNGTQVLLKWNTAYDPNDPNVPDDRTIDTELRFRVYRFPKASGSGPAPTRVYNNTTMVANLSQNVREWVDPNGASGSNEYAWLIRAVDEHGVESPNTAEVTLDTNLPPTFSGVTTVTPSGLRSVNLAWSLATDDRTPTNLITYKIHQLEVPVGTPTGTDPGNPIPAALIDQLFATSPVEQILGQVSTLTRTVPDANKMYIFGIRAFDAQGAGDTNRRAAGVPANNPPTFSGLESVTEVPGGNVRLSWITATDDKEASNQLLYRVYRYKSSSASETSETVRALGTLHRTSSAGATSLDDDAVDPATNNHYLVRAVDLDQAEDSNTLVKTVLKDTVNPVFLGIKSAAMDQGGARISLVWDPASDNRTQASKIKYRVYESLQPSLVDLLAASPIAELTNGQVSFSRTPPTGAKYYYLVRAVDEAGNMDGNESVKFTVDEVPPAFAGLINAYAITGNSAQVFWTSIPNDDIAKVKIYRAEDLTNPIANINARDPAGQWVNSYLVTGLNNATSYTFIARASDLYGNEDANSVAKEITTLAGQSPTFAGLQGAEALDGIPGMSGVRLNWSPAANATHYRIFRKPGTSELGEGFDFNYDTCNANWGAAAAPGCIEIEASSLSSYEVTGLVKNSTYSFIIRAVAKVGPEVTGEELNRVIRKARTIDEVAPMLDGAASAAPSAGSSGLSNVVVKWDPPKADGVYDGFRVLYKQLAAPAMAFSIPSDLSTDPLIGVVNIGDPVVRESNVSGLTYAARYCFTVVTSYSAVPSIRSVPKSPGGFKCTSPVPQPPDFAGVKSGVVKGAGGLAFSQLTVSWEPAQGSFTGYEVSWSKTNDWISDSQPGSFFAGANTHAIATRSATSHSITGLEANKTYYVRVRARFDNPTPSISLRSGGDVVAQAVTSPKIPSGDGMLSAKQVGDDQIEIRWGAPTNDGLYNRYYVFRAEGPNAESDVVAQAQHDAGANPPYMTAPFADILSTAGANFDQRIFFDAGLLPDTKYCYLVRAAFSSVQGFIGSSNALVKCVEVRINPPTFFGVANVRTPTTASGFNTLIAEWEPATGNFTRYEYAIGPEPDAATTWVAVAGGAGTTSATIGGLAPNATYYVKVRATYVKNGNTFASGQNALAQGLTTPKSPQHGGLEPIAFLANPGEVRIKWTVPNANVEVGGLYDRYLVWKYTGGSAAAIFQEIDTLMADGHISDAEVNSASYHMVKVDKSVTQMDLVGFGRLPENVETCFLVRAAFLQGANFVMSGNQTVRCVTPTASAPQFGGLATLENIPLSVNGFLQLKATWLPASGNFTRYEIAVAESPNSQSWSPAAFTSGNVNVDTATLTHLDATLPQNSNKLQAFKRYYARARAIYVGAGNAIYSAGESGELSQVVSPDRPDGDGIKGVDVDKVAGQAPAARLVINGNVPGLWDKAYVFRSTNIDESAARADVMMKSQVNAFNSAFSGTPLAVLNRPSPTSTSDISYKDTSITLGLWNCYVVRSAYAAAPWFLGSKGAQTPVCRQPIYNPVGFAGLAPTGTTVCQEQANPADPQPCDPGARWPYSGNSRVVLKLASVPQGDIDFYDVYYGYSDNADEILARGVYQTILRADPQADSAPEDDLLLVGGDPALALPGGKLHFLVRARCLGCTYVDSNKNVSNEVSAKRPWLVTDFRFQATSSGASFVENKAGPGRFEDPLNYQNFQSDGTSALTAADDYLKATHPGTLAPRPNSTFAIKFDLSGVGDTQNVEGAALFAADSSPRGDYYENLNGTFVRREGSLFGINGASTVYDRRNGVCLWIGGHAGNARDFGDYPIRDWATSWQSNRGAFARRFQQFDGRNFSEIYTRDEVTKSPLPRSFPVVAYNPARDTVWLFGGLDQGTPQTLRADTWEWDGRSWTRLDLGPTSPQTDPTGIGRYGANVMAFDPFRKEMVMVGGRYGVAAIGSSTSPDQSHAQITRMSETPDSNLDVLSGKTRVDAMAHYTFDSATQKFTWKKTSPLPGTFPKGYPAALVAVPSDKVAADGVNPVGLYYFSVTWNSMDNATRNHVWHWDGDMWQMLANTQIPDSTPHSNLMAAYDETKDRIILTFGRGNDPEKRRVWEFNPAAAKLGQGANAYTKRYLTDAPPTFSGMPCFDPERRIIVDHGGLPVWDREVNTVVNVRERTPQDIFVYSLATDTWKRMTPGYDYTGQGHALSPSTARKGVFAQGGSFLNGWNSGWDDWMQTFTSWSFSDGVWKRLFDTDITRKWRTNAEYEGGINNTSGFNRALPIVDGATEKLYVVNVSDTLNDPSPTTGRGRPIRLREFDGSGWNHLTMDTSSITFPDHRCSTLIQPESQWAMRPDKGLGWHTVSTPWGIFMKGPPFVANIPWDPASNTTNCSASLVWRRVNSPYMIAAKESSSWKVRELKAAGSGSSSDPKWCATVGSSAANPDLLPNFKGWPSRMVWDEPNQRIVVYAYDFDRATYYPKAIQAIKRKVDPDPTKQCFFVENITASFPNTAWTQMVQKAEAYDMPLWDEARGKLIVLSAYETPNAQGEKESASVNGFLWELDVRNANATTPGTWTFRPLPAEYRRWTVLQGNSTRMAVPVPGKPGEFLLQSDKEIQDKDRPISNTYILKVTDSTLSLRPAPPRFGVTMGADRASGWISVPGDPGDADGTLGAHTIYKGARKFTDNLLGEHTLFVVFGTNTYSVYMDGSATPLVSNVPWSGSAEGIYVQDFILGARWGQYLRHGDSNLRQFKGIGNTRVEIDWVRSFDKALTPTEMQWWDGFEEDAP